MDYRTLKFALRRNPANSQAIGYLATQQNSAYNHAADLLNREPHLPKRSARVTPMPSTSASPSGRQAKRKKANAPYHIHQQGAEEAWTSRNPRTSSVPTEAPRTT